METTARGHHSAHAVRVATTARKSGEGFVPNHRLVLVDEIATFWDLTWKRDNVRLNHVQVRFYLYFNLAIIRCLHANRTFFNLLVLDIDFTVTFKLNHLLWNDELLDNSSYLRQNISNELKTAVSKNIWSFSWSI
jgi:hypothetical protein